LHGWFFENRERHIVVFKIKEKFMMELLSYLCSGNSKERLKTIKLAKFLKKVGLHPLIRKIP